MEAAATVRKSTVFKFWKGKFPKEGFLIIIFSFS